MKKILLMAIGFLPMFVYGQLSLFTDDFESYTAGEPLAANSPVWTTWSGGVASEDADVSNAQASSGSNSVYVTGSATDLVLPFESDYTSGIYEMTMKVFVTGGHGAYWNYQATAVPGTEWMFEIYFDSDGSGFINAGGTTAATFEYTLDTWTSFKIQVNLTNDQAEVWIDGNSLYTWQWSLSATGGGTLNSWGGMDIYAAAPVPTTADFYVDDVTFSQIFGTGISEQNINSGIQISPNPSNGEFGIVMNAIPAGQYKMQIADMRGMIVSNEAIQIDGSTKKNFNVDLPAGVYFLKLSNEGFETTRKIVIN